MHICGTGQHANEVITVRQHRSQRRGRAATAGRRATAPLQRPRTSPYLSSLPLFRHSSGLAIHRHGICGHYGALARFACTNTETSLHKVSPSLQTTRLLTKLDCQSPLSRDSILGFSSLIPVDFDHVRASTWLKVA